MITRSTHGTGPRVLVAFASRHGGTREIAAAIARGLTGATAARSLSVVLSPVERRPDPAGFDAVVLGSAVYEGRWLESAVRYAHEVATLQAGDSTWLFSSGLPSVSRLSGGMDDVRRLTVLLGARGNRDFAGRSEPRLLSAAERAVWDGAAVTGDFRDWRAVRSWSEEIAADVVRAPSLAPAG